METRYFENLGVHTSLLGFGAMRFPVANDGKIDRKRSVAMLNEAYEAGVNYFDTAYSYHNGESEPFLGEYLSTLERSTYYLATKLPQWLINSLDDAKRIFQEQLDRLQKTYFDFYLIHAIDKKAFDKMVNLGVVSYLEEEQKKGRIKFLGFSFHSIYEDFEYITKFRKWDFLQIQYNYLDTEEQAGDKGYELCEKLGIPMIIMEPIKGGSLANLSPDMQLQIDNLESKGSAASYALRWVADHQNVKVILSGMSTEEQVAENLKTFAAYKPLSAKENETLAQIADTMHKRIGNECTGCKYCMPCPFGVDIPGNFSLWNKMRMFQNYDVVKKMWEMESQQPARPSSCTECGACMVHCPQHIEIPMDLKRVQSEFDAARK